MNGTEQRCGNSSSAKGDVSVSVKVTPEGTVSSVTIKSTPDQALAACVEREAKLGTFAKTKRGGSFAYLWRF
jgi:outer membrane biosynthesis protein TonB